MADRRQAARRGWERRRERDEREAGNLPAHLRPLWERIKARIKPTDGTARWEMFLDYVHDTGDEWLEACQQDADVAVARMLEAHARADGFDVDTMHDAAEPEWGSTRTPTLYVQQSTEPCRFSLARCTYMLHTLSRERHGAATEDEAMSTTSIYEVRRSNGRTTDHDTYRAAIEACRQEWGPDVVVEHDGDLTDGGERTLVWEDEASSVDDDGARAVASIVPAVAYETLQALRREAVDAGDSRQARLCTEAMAGDVAAEGRCARAIDDARVQS